MGSPRSGSINPQLTRRATVKTIHNTSNFQTVSHNKSAGSVASLAQLKKPDLVALQKELERDPQHESPFVKFLKRVRKRYLDLKNGFFATLVALLVESHNSVITLLTIFIEFVQNLAFCFSGVDWGPYGNKYGVVLIFFQIEEAVVEYTFADAIIVINAIAVVLIVTMLMLAVYVVQSFMNSDFNKGVWPLRLLRTLVSMLASVFFLPVVNTLFSIFVCRHDRNDCYTNPLYVTFRAIAVIALPTFIAFTLLMSMTYFNPNPRVKSIDARPTARLELVELTAKIALAAFFVFARDDAVLRESVTLFCSLLTAVFMWIYIPYYNKAINLFRFSLISEVIWGSCLALVVTTKGNTEEIKNYIFYAYLAGIIPVSLLAFFLFKARQNHATSFEIASRNFKPDNTDAFNVWETDASKDGEHERRFWAPSQVEIATRFLIGSSDPKALEIADKIYLFGTKKFPQSSSLMVKIPDAIFFLVFKEDASVAASYLKKAEKAKQMLIDTEFTIYQQQQEIKAGAATVGNKKLDAVDRVEFKQLMKEAKHYYSEARASIANFWLAIMTAEENEQVDTSILMTHVSQMERSDHNATEAYNRLTQRYPLSVKVLASYANFLAEIHNNHEESDKIRRRIKRICDAGLSDDVQQKNSGSYSSGMSKKSQKAFKDYRKQVYHYSKGNSALLTWMIRGIQVFFIALASTQLYLNVRGSSEISVGVSYLQRLNTCQSIIGEIHSNFRQLQHAISVKNHSDADLLKINISNSSFIISDESLQLYYDTLSKPFINAIWATEHVAITLFNGQNIPRTQLNMSLMDATFLYVQRVQSVLSSELPVEATDLDSSNSDWRFVMDNGLTAILNSFTDLEHVLAEEIRRSVFALQYAQIAIFVFCAVSLVITYFFLFAPVIKKAKSERETSLKAFLQIPRFVTHTLYAKYFVPESNSREDLNTNDDDEKNSMSWKSSMKAQTGYNRMSTISRNGLITIGSFFIGAFAIDLWFLTAIISIPGAISATYDITVRTTRVVTVAQDVANWGNSTFQPTISAFPSVSKKDQILIDVKEILESQMALLYGSFKWPNYVQKLDKSLTSSLYPDNSDSSTYNDLMSFVADSTVVANTDSITSENPNLKGIISLQQKIVDSYTEFLSQIIDWSNSSLKALLAAAYSIWAVMVIIVLATYYFFWRKILNYLIKTENERTLKLLLMIPVEIVADIDSLRELLHLKRNTISLNTNTGTSVNGIAPTYAPVPSVTVSDQQYAPQIARPGIDMSESEDEDMYSSPPAARKNPERTRRGSVSSVQTQQPVRKLSLSPSLHVDHLRASGVFDSHVALDVPPPIPFVANPIPKPIPRISPLPLAPPAHRMSAGVQAFIQRESVTRRNGTDDALGHLSFPSSRTVDRNSEVKPVERNSGGPSLNILETRDFHFPQARHSTSNNEKQNEEPSGI